MQKLAGVNADVIFPILIVPGVFLAVAVIAIYQAKQVGKNFVAMAGKLGLTLETTGKFFKKHRLTGQLRGKPVEVFSYTTGAGKSRRTWAALAVTVGKTGGLTFSLERRVLVFDVIARMFRKNEVKSGDALFDRDWVLKTNQPDFMQAILLPELRLKLMRYAGGGSSSPSFKLETYRVQYSEQGSFSTVKVCVHIEECTGLLCDLADAVEVVAEMNNRPS